MAIRHHVGGWGLAWLSYHVISVIQHANSSPYHYSHCRLAFVIKTNNQTLHYQQVIYKCRKFHNLRWTGGYVGLTDLLNILSW